jgi:hypothetical protein
MIMNFFCLDCEDNFSGIGTDNETCPFCGSENVMPDSEISDWNDGHFEGSIHERTPMNDMGDD